MEHSHASDEAIAQWENALGCLREFLAHGLCVRDQDGRIVFLPLCNHDTEVV